jgi:hypothetical protein
MIDPFEFTKPQKKKNHLSLITWLLESVSQSVIHLSGASTSFVPHFRRPYYIFRGICATTAIHKKSLLVK